jgi:hypothetical protein
MGFSIVDNSTNALPNTDFHLTNNLPKQQIHLHKFTEIINLFAIFFSEQLGKKINIKSTALLM